MNHLDSTISDWNGIHMAVNTDILNKDKIELNNQSRNQTDGSDVINLISIHTDRNLISSVFTIHHKLLSVLNAPISFADPEARVSSALYLFKVKPLEGGYYLHLLLATLCNVEMHLEGYSQVFHHCSNEVRRRNRVVLLYKQNDELDPSSLVNGYIASSLLFTDANAHREANEIFIRLFGLKNSFLNVAFNIKSIKQPYKFPRIL